MEKGKNESENKNDVSYDHSPPSCEEI